MTILVCLLRITDNNNICLENWLSVVHLTSGNNIIVKLIVKASYTLYGIMQCYKA